MKFSAPVPVKWIASFINAEIIGDQDGEATGINEIHSVQRGDIVFVDINTVGKSLEAEQIFGTIEAVKTVSDLFSPVAGTILEVNAALNNNPELVNTDPYGEGWMVKIEVSDPQALDALLEAPAYEQLVG